MPIRVVRLLRGRGLWFVYFVSIQRGRTKFRPRNTRLNQDGSDTDPCGSLYSVAARLRVIRVFRGRPDSV
jgi:hypothetical protein